MSHPQPAILPAEDEAEEWQPRAPEEFQEVGKVGRIAIGLLGASTVTHLLSTWSDWNTYGVVHRYLGGGLNVDDADLNRADTISRVTSIPNVIVSVAAAVVFVIWLWRSRVNSEVLCQADHRHSHGWVLAGWFCPGPNLWYPKQIVDDVWLASDPQTPVWSDDLRRLKKPLLTSVWWCTWVGALAFDVVIRRVLMWMQPTVGTLRGIALAGTASLILTVASALGAALVIRKITALQIGRPWAAWWDQREPQLTAVPTCADDDTSEQQAVVDADAAMVAPPLRLERQRELQPVGAGGSEWSSAPAARLSAVPGSAFPVGAGAASLSGSPLGGSPLAPAAGLGSPYAGDADAPYNWPGKSANWPGKPGPKEEAAPVRSPFAPVVESWRDPADAGPATQQFNPYEAWRNEPGPVEEAPASLRPSAGVEPPVPSWSTSANPSTPSDDLLSGPLPSWQAETVAPPSLSVVRPEAPSWSKSYADSYSYETESSPDYLAPSTPIPAPEPASAPAARSGRRAARVAVDSPSAIQAAVSEPGTAGRGYLEQAPVVSGPPPSPPDDFLTPSKPLPPVPSYGPEPSYTSEPAYTSYEPPAQTGYESSYRASEPTYSPEPYQYSAEPTYSSATGYSSSYDSYEAPAAQPSYESPYSPSSYRSESAHTPSEPTYESSYSPEPSYPSDSYGSSYSSPDYSSSYSEPAAEPPHQPSDPSSGTPTEPAARDKDDSEITAPRTHPRRRWV